MKATVKKPASKPATEIYDRGRRGEPLLGCDCVQCFGYCMVDHDVARRELPNREEGTVDDKGSIELEAETQ